MEVKTLPKQEFLVRNLSTRSVVLYPTRAHVVREINDIQLSHGINEIEIYGLTPTADEGSIKVEGTGGATISNMSVELVANREIFEEIYPDDESDVEASEDEESEQEDENIESMKRKIKQLELYYGHTKEAIESVAKRLSVLDSYSQSADAEKVDPEALESILNMYQKRREQLRIEHDKAVASSEELQDQIKKMKSQLKKASKPARIEKEKKDKAKSKKKMRELRIRSEERKEKKRVKDEHIKFWPKRVYKISLHLEASVDTPSMSRRSSVSSITLGKDPRPSKDLAEGSNENSAPARSISIALSYVTAEASWLPRYDVNLSTPTKTGTIQYRAEFTNQTSEVWKDAQISLSTSQASFQGLNDEVPFMNPWIIGVAKINHGNEQPALTSFQEIRLRNTHQKQQQQGSKIVRGQLFGLDQNYAWNSQNQVQNVAPGANNVSSFATQARIATNELHKTKKMEKSLFASAQAANSNNANAFGSQPQGFGQQQQQQQFQQQFQQQPQAPFRQAVEDNEAVPHISEDLLHVHAAAARARQNDTHVDPMSLHYNTPIPLDFEESVWEDHGLTTSYDLPGLRTLSPSSKQSQHKIATMHIKDIQLTSIAVPKLRAAAFLRARFRNPSSSVTLLKGAAGLTLDGTFLGTTTIPRVSPHEIMTLPLGVDPAIHIAYSKPTVRRATQGLLFNKESTQMFTRTIWISNTKISPVDLLVLDQVPVSEDEKLRVEITSPRGLTQEESRVSCGMAASQNAANTSSSSSSGSSNVAKKWGRAYATLKKNNEVRFDVSLEKGASCRLVLEYDVRAPTGDTVISK